MEYEEYTYEHLDGEVKIDSTFTYLFSGV